MYFLITFELRKGQNKRKQILRDNNYERLTANSGKTTLHYQPGAEVPFFSQVKLHIVSMTEMDNESLLVSFQRGEEAAFDQLFRMYFPSLSFFANKLVGDQQLAEDIVQDCFVELWQRRRAHQHVHSIKSYLYRCIHNHAVTELKKKKPGLLVVEFSSKTIEQEIIAAETLQHILQVVQHLPARMQQVLKMFYLEEKSYLEIGKEIGIDPETVRSHRFRAIQFVRKTIIPG